MQIPENKEQRKWYFRTSVIILAFLAIGPFALPLVWFNPHFSRKAKIITSIIVIVLTYYLGILLVKALVSLKAYYQEINRLINYGTY